MGRISGGVYRYNQVVDAVEHREQLLQSGQLSLPSDEGQAVIITSGGTKENKQTLAEHAQVLAADRARRFLGATILLQPALDEIIEVIRNPEVASMAFIGDGAFSSFTIGDGGQRLDWRSAARAASHLKQGSMELRTCSRIISPHKEARVSMAAFLVDNQTNILGTVDKSFADHNGFDEFNLFLGQIYAKPHNSAEELRRPIGYDLDATPV